MPTIPTSDPYVSSRVGHGIPQLAPQMDIHMADPLFKGRIENLQRTEVAVKGAIEYVVEADEKFKEERQRDVDFQAMIDFQTEDAQHELAFNESIQKAEPEQYEKMYRDFSNGRVSRLNQHAGSVSKSAWMKMREGVLRQYATDAPAIKKAEINGLRARSIAKLEATLHGIRNAPREAYPGGSVERQKAYEKIIGDALEEGIITPEQADKARLDGAREIWINDALRDAEENAKVYAEDDDAGTSQQIPGREYMTEADDRSIREERKRKGQIFKRDAEIAIKEQEQAANQSCLSTFIGEKGEKEEDKEFTDRRDMDSMCSSPAELKLKYPGMSSDAALQIHRMYQAEREADAKGEDDDLKKQYRLAANDPKAVAETIKWIQGNPSKKIEDYIPIMLETPYMYPEVRDNVRKLIREKTGGNVGKAKVPEGMDAAWKAFDTKFSGEYALSTTDQRPFILEKGTEWKEGHLWGLIGSGYANGRTPEEIASIKMRRYVETRDRMYALALTEGMTPETFNKQATALMDNITFTEMREKMVKAGVSW